MLRGVGSTAVQDRAETLFRKLSGILRQFPSRTSPEAVHQLRTTIRRIETLIHARRTDTRPGIRKLTKQLTRLRRRAGRVRDIDVQLIALRGVHLENSSREKSLVIRYLVGLRHRQEMKLIRALEQELDSGLKKRIRRGTDVLGNGSEGSAHRNYTAEALRRFRALDQGYPALTEDNLHALRMDCKRIRYLAEMNNDSTASRTVVAELKRIQDAIGEWHDWLTLTELASEILPTTNSSLIAALRARRHLKLNEALCITAEVRQRLLQKTKSLRPAKTSDRKLVA